MPRSKAANFMLFLAAASLPAAAVAQSTNGAVPGSLRFIQGEANIDGRPIDTNHTTSLQRSLRGGEILATSNGRADVLLAPGALLRIGQDTTVEMVAADAGRTEVRLQQGRANVSVNAVQRDHLLLVDTRNGQTQVLSRGLYTFDSATNTLRVFHGEAYAFPGADTTSNVKPVTVKEGHEFVLGGDRARPEKFDPELADTDLLPWTGPQETQAALADPSLRHADESGHAGTYNDAGYLPGAYGFSGSYGYGDPYLGGWGSPYGWGPYGFYGYPFFGVGFGYWGGGFYRGGVYRGYPYPIKGPGRFGGATGGYIGRGVTPRNLGNGSARSGAGIIGGGAFHGGGSSGHR